MKHHGIVNQGAVLAMIVAFGLMPAAGALRAANTPILQTFAEADKGVLGPLWHVTEPATWSGWWSQRANTGGVIIYDAAWKNANGAMAKDVIYVESWNRATGEIVLWRQGNNGRYRGVFANDRLQKGTASWYAAGWTWSAFVIRREQNVPQDDKGKVNSLRGR